MDHKYKVVCFISKKDKKAKEGMLSYNFGGGGEYYGMSAADQRKGGLMDDDLSSLSDDDGEQQDMEEDAGEMVDPKEEEHVEAAMLRFPQPVPLIELSEDRRQFRFLADRIPVSLPSIAPPVLKAMATLTEATSKQKAGIAFHSCMPMPVHGSPLVSLFANKFVLPKGQTATLQQRPYKDKYVSFMFSCYQLQQLKLACLNGLIPFHPSITERKMLAAHVEYLHQIKLIGTVQDNALDALYAKAVNGVAVSMVAIMNEFITLLESYSLQYIHLLEYFIHTCLVAPHGIPLEACLTPNETPPLALCGAQQQQTILDDLILFFKHKVSYRAEQEKRNVVDHVSDIDASSTTKLNIDAIEPIVKGRTQELYNGYIPLSTLYEYFCFLDCDGVLNSK